MTVSKLSTLVFGRGEDAQTLRSWLRRLGVEVTEDGTCGELRPCFPYRHGHWKVEYPEWVWEQALLRHGWERSDYEIQWMRKRKPDGPIEFYNKRDMYPYYPQTQRKIWRAYINEKRTSV